MLLIKAHRSLLFFLLSFALANSQLTISPYIYFSFNKDSDMYRELDTPISSIRFGGEFTYTKNKLRLKSNISYNLFNGSNILPDDFRREQGLGKIETNPGLNSSQFNYFESLLFLDYSFNNFEVYTNISSPEWGDGISKTILSGKTPPYFNMGYIWEINDKITYEHMYGKLVSLIPDSSLSHIYDTEYRDSYFNRNIMAHRISYDYSERIKLYLYEIIVYGGNREFEFYYALPLVPFIPIQTYLGDIDNDLISIGLNYNIYKNAIIYFNLTIDEWTPPYTFNKDNKNWFVYQIGSEFKSMLADNDALRWEYIWSDYRVYRHRFDINNFYSYDYPMGFWAGPHSEHFFIDYTFNLGYFRLTLMYSDAKRGALTSSMLDNQYSDNNYFNRYSNGYERKIINGINLGFMKLESTILNIGFNSINWINPSFELNANNDLSNKNIIKNDYYINIKYHLKNE